MPAQAGSYFADTLTLICEHSADGAMGLMLNRPSRIPLSELMQQLGAEPSVPLAEHAALLKGGPVARDQAFVLHSADVVYENSLPLMAAATLTTDRQILQDIAQGNGPARYLVACGYAGWGPGQLEQELAADAWFSLALHAPLSMASLFDMPAGERLPYAAACAGVDLQLMGGRIGYA